MIVRKRMIIALMCQVLAIGTLCFPSPGKERKQSSRILLFQDWRAGTLTFDEGSGPLCDFDPEHRFNLLDMYKDVLSSPNGKYAAVVCGLERPGDQLEPPVLPCWPGDPDHPCAAVVVVIDLKTCNVVRTIKVWPRPLILPPDSPEASFGGSDHYLSVKYALTTDFYEAPDFTQRLTVPFKATVLGELPGGGVVTAGEILVGAADTYYVVLAKEGKQMTEIARRPMAEWGSRLVGDWDAPGGWQALFADDRAFVVLYPSGQGGNKEAGPMVEAYRFSGGSPAREDLPAGAEDIEARRDDVGRLVCSWRVGEKRVRRELIFSKASSEEPCASCRRVPEEATHWIDAQGNLIRLSDRQVCSFNRYAQKGDGERYDFLPYLRESYVWASPQGHYVALAGALKPEQNPEKSAKVDRPGYFRKGYDSVFAVVNLDECRIARFASIPPGETDETTSRLTPDDALLIVGRKVYPAPDFQELELPRSEMLATWPWTPIDEVELAGKGATLYGFAGVYSYYGYPLLLREKSQYKVVLIRGLPSALPSRVYDAHLVYADEDVAAILLCDSLLPQDPSAVALVNSRSEKVEATLKLPSNARSISVEREKDGTLVCKYREAGRHVVKRLSPGASTPGAKPQQADN